MAVDMFLKIAEVPGESADSVHAKDIDVLSWEFGVTQSGTMHIATGGGSGKANFSDMRVHKWVDSATHTLFGSVSDGRSFKKAELFIRKAAGKAPLEYLIITMTDLIVTSYQTGGTQSDDRLTETVMLNFAKVKFSYKPQKADQTADAAKEFEWNIAKNCVG